MPATLQATFERRRAEIQRIGWPTPGTYFPVDQRSQKVWLDYWASLQRRYALADYVVHNRADIPPPPAPQAYASCMPIDIQPAVSP